MERKENIDENVKETVDWLHTFDKKEKKKAEDNALDAYLDKKK